MSDFESGMGSKADVRQPLWSYGLRPGRRLRRWPQPWQAVCPSCQSVAAGALDLTPKSVGIIHPVPPSL